MRPRLGVLFALLLAACAAPNPGGAPASLPGADIAATKTFADCSDCPTMVALNPGRFVMGAPAGGGYMDYERPRHDVEIVYRFALGRAPVTRREFADFVAATGYQAGGGCDQHNDEPRVVPKDAALDWKNPGFPQTDSDPVVCVSGADAQAYIDWLAKRTGKPYRLPSEAEWEYAAKGGNYLARYFPSENLADYCRYVNGADADFEARFGPGGAVPNNTACHDGYVFTAPVGSFPPNPFGLQDMIGNVMQIMADDYHDSYQGAPADGRAWTNQDQSNVLRGGSWYTGAGGLDAVWRTGQDSGWRLPFAGFRVARTLTAFD